jgi:uncharacterized protein (DUF4415 family)
MFRGALVVQPDTAEDYGEQRWVGIGMTRGRVAFVAFAERPQGTIRIISMRKAIMKNGSNTKKRSRPDGKRIDSLRDKDIDYSDIPKQGSDFFAEAILWPGPKKQITLRLDPDVLAFFRKSGRGYQTMINAVLRKYVAVVKGRQK